MNSSGCFVFLGLHNVSAFLLPPQQRDDFYVSSPSWWPPSGCCRLQTVPLTPVFVYYRLSSWKTILVSRHLTLVLTESYIMDGIQFLFVGSNNVLGYHRVDYRPQRFIQGVIVPSSASFRTGTHSYGFRHIIDGSEIHYRGSSVAFQQTDGLDWTQCSNEEYWFYYSFDFSADYEVPASVIIRYKQDTKGNVILGRTLLVRSISWEIWDERHVTFNGAKVLVPGVNYTITESREAVACM